MASGHSFLRISLSVYNHEKLYKTTNLYSAKSEGSWKEIQRHMWEMISIRKADSMPRFHYGKVSGCMSDKICCPYLLRVNYLHLRSTLWIMLWKMISLSYWFTIS